MKSVNMNILNCVLLVVILVIVIFCCMNKSNEGFRSRQKCAHTLDKDTNIDAAITTCLSDKCCRKKMNLFGKYTDGSTCYDMCNTFETLPDHDWRTVTMYPCSNLSKNDCKHPFYKHCKWKKKKVVK